MRYAYKDLGPQPEGATAIVRWRGSAADVLLLDPVNFSKYCDGMGPVFYRSGGHYGAPPACLAVPKQGRWYVVADLGGHSAHAKPTVELLTPANQPQSPDEEALVEVG